MQYCKCVQNLNFTWCAWDFFFALNHECHQYTLTLDCLVTRLGGDTVQWLRKSKILQMIILWRRDQDYTTNVVVSVTIKKILSLCVCVTGSVCMHDSSVCQTLYTCCRETFSYLSNFWSLIFAVEKLQYNEILQHN